MHGNLSTHSHLGAAGEADTGLSSSVSLLHLASGALWLGAAVEMAQTHQGLASAASLRLGGDDAVSGTQFIEGSSVHTEQKC